MKGLARHFAGAAAATMIAGAVSADPIAIDFTTSVTDATKPFMTGEADGVMALVNAWPGVEDPGGPLDGIKGECFGAGKMVAGRMTGDGYCAYTDPEGQTLFVRWYLDDSPAVAGPWQFAGGTGKWATATGGGTYVNTEPDASGIVTSHVTGTVEFR
jgi:hypothetical protein